MLANASICCMFYFVDPILANYRFVLGTISHTLFFIMEAYSSPMESLHGFLPIDSSKQVSSDSIILVMRASYLEYLWGGMLVLTEVFGDSTCSFAAFNSCSSHFGFLFLEIVGFYFSWCSTMGKSTPSDDISSSWLGASVSEMSLSWYEFWRAPSSLNFTSLCRKNFLVVGMYIL